MWLDNSIQDENGGDSSIKNVRAAVLCIIVVLIGASRVPPSSGGDHGRSPLMTDGTVPSRSGPLVSIDSDQELLDWADAMGFSGDGTEADPVVVRDLDLDARGGPDVIYLGNITLHCIIIEVVVTNATSYSGAYHPGAGISVHSSSNIRMENITALNCRYGISLKWASRCSVVGSQASFNSVDGIYLEHASGCMIRDSLTFFDTNDGLCARSCDRLVIDGLNSSYNDFGIYLRDCRDCDVSNGTIHDNDDHGVRLDRSEGIRIHDNAMAGNDDGVHLYDRSNGNFVSNNSIMEMVEYGIYTEGSNGNVFQGNRMVNCGFMLEDEEDTIRDQFIEPTNTVNGEPVLYMKDTDGGGIVRTDPAGQLILYNVSDLVFRGSDISRGTAGAILWECRNVTLDGCDISDNTYFGVRATRTESLSCEGIISSGNLDAIVLSDTSARVENASISDGVFGIRATSDCDLDIQGSNFSGMY